MVRYRESFSAVRKDPHWKRKLALGVLITLIPYLGVIWMMGWLLEYQRSVAWGRDDLLPEWSSFKSQALLGLKSYVVVMPYSLVLSAVLTPPVVAVEYMAGLFSSPPAEPNVWLLIGGMSVVGVLAMVAGAMIIPWTGSAMLRLSLFGTIESGFQYKEIRRLMRENKRELRRAWGWSMASSGISLIAAVVYLGIIALVIAVLPGAYVQRAIVTVVVVLVGYIGMIVMLVGLGIYLGAVNMQLFGQYGRVAYGLDAAQAVAIAAAQAGAEAQTPTGPTTA